MAVAVACAVVGVACTYGAAAVWLAGTAPARPAPHPEEVAGGRATDAVRADRAAAPIAIDAGTADAGTADAADAAVAAVDAVDAGPTAPTVAVVGGTCPALIINFHMASARTPRSAGAAVDALATWLAAHPSALVMIDGHADSSGSDYGNMVLSRHRAAAVRRDLERRGAATARMTVRGFGTYWPVDDQPPDSSWNRRVVVQTKGGAGCPRDREEIIEP